MSPLRVAIVIGTRPDAIKMAPVVQALRRRPDRFDTRVVATAQHREMLDQVLGVFGIEPDVDLDLMQAGQGLAELTARLLENLERLWRRLIPDVVLVQGDTTSSFAAALAAYYQKVPVGHVEAGLRSRNKYAPFPEEINRRLIGGIAELHFAPTDSARQHLLGEGVEDSRILVTGNTSIDALLHTVDWIRATGFRPESLNPAVFEGNKLVLVTAHRRESFGEGLQRICQALRMIGQSRPDAAVVYPVHPNPNVDQPVRASLADVRNIHLTAPLDYRTFIYTMARADVVLTDSGGVQEEAPSLHRPVLVLREVTERTEAIDAGCAELVGTDAARIVDRTLQLLDQPPTMPQTENPFGDGQAGERIARALLAWSRA